MKRLLKLNRYTSLPILLDILERRKIVFSNYEKWEDRNDSEILNTYKAKKNLGSLFVLCFSYDTETIHHWKAFSYGMSGCCIEFNYSKLITATKNNKYIRHDIVDYLRINQINPNFINIDEVPFKKRFPYRIESEYRMIYETKKTVNSFELPISLSAINKITFSQDIPDTVLDSIRLVINNSRLGQTIKINKSTVFQNDIWINAINSI